MKYLIKTLVVVLAFSMVMISCKKDDDKEDSKSNELVVNGTSYELSQGTLENYGIWTSSGATNIDLILLSPGITIHEEGGEFSYVTGTGHYVYFEMFTSGPTGLDVGTYTYNASSTASGTFDYSFYGLNINFDTGSGSPVSITGGTVTISANGSTYEITLALTDAMGQAVTGYYKGSLRYYNYDDRIENGQKPTIILQSVQ
ncbi:MAG: hypothetical protein JW894_07855 [Bacteroidales bacterium]|nr:hypothetical protein [Bacteroidales bacterium]